MSKENPTPSDLLMDVMESFGESEPQKIVVIHTTEDGSLIIRSLHAENTTLVGILDVAKHIILTKVFASN